VASPPFRPAPYLNNNTDISLPHIHFPAFHSLSLRIDFCLRPFARYCSTSIAFTPSHLSVTAIDFVHLNGPTLQTPKQQTCSPASQPAPPAPSSDSTPPPPQAALRASSRWPGRSRSPVCPPTTTHQLIYLLLTNHRRTRGFRPRYVGRVRRAYLHCLEQDGRAQGRRLG
jgi:hypothetical protein